MMSLAHYLYQKERWTMKSKWHAYSRKLIGVGIVMSGLCVGLLAFGQSRDAYPSAAGGPPDYELSWYTIDGGGRFSADAGISNGVDFVSC